MSNTYEGVGNRRLPAHEIRQQNVSAINDLIIKARELDLIQSQNGALFFDIPFTKERDTVEPELKGVKPASFLTILRVKKHQFEEISDTRYSLTYTDTAIHDGTRYYMGKVELQFKEPSAPVKRRVEISRGFGNKAEIDSLDSETENELAYDLALADRRLDQIAVSKPAGELALKQAA